jgi:MFS family permease
MFSLTHLDALNFSLAGAREGFGPFLGVYLQARGFNPAQTGIAMALAGVAGLLATTPIGALVDRITPKRTVLVLAVIGIAIGAVLIVAAKSIVTIGAAQMLIGVADTSIAPLVASLTLGLVGARAYGARVSRNEAYNHAGNAANAALAAVLGYTLGLGYVAIAIVVMAVASSAVVARIDPAAIDHAVARGGEVDGRSTYRVLVQTPALLLLAATVLLFETANGAMLPFLAQSLTAHGGNPSVTTGVMTVVSQAAMVGAALMAATTSRRYGHSGVMAIAIAIVALRGLLAVFAKSWGLIIPIEILDGLATGLAGVAIPALVAEIMRDTGHATAGLGGVMTAFSAGAALSPLLAGFVAQYFGFASSFIALAIVAVLALLLWTLGRQYFGIVVPDCDVAQPGACIEKV